MNEKKFTTLITLLVLYSCSQKNPFPYTTKEFDLASNSSITYGKKIDFEVLGLDDIFIWDSLLIITTNDARGMVKVFNKNTFELLANLACKGRGHNEFTTLSNASWQAYVVNGDLMIPFQDYGVLKEINITQSLLEHKTIIGSSVECYYNGDFRSVAIDHNINNRFEYKSVLPDKVVRDKVTKPQYLIHNYDKKNIRKFKVFDSNVKSVLPQDLYSYVKSTLYAHPNRNTFIQPFSIMNYIVVVDLDNKSTFALHRSKTSSFNEVLPPLNNVETSFSSCVTTDDFFLILYFADREQYIELTKGPKLLAFDWDGNLIASTILDPFCLNIAFDNETSTLYGADPFKEIMYSFDISDILSQ